METGFCLVVVLIVGCPVVVFSVAVVAVLAVVVVVMVEGVRIANLDPF